MTRVLKLIDRYAGKSRHEMTDYPISSHVIYILCKIIFMFTYINSPEFDQHSCSSQKVVKRINPDSLIHVRNSFGSVTVIALGVLYIMIAVKCIPHKRSHKWHARNHKSLKLIV